MATPSADTLIAGRYRIIGLLGRGGMAEVYEAFDERLHRPVAVKLLGSQMAAQEDVRLRFEAEARSAARLAHPNVVAIYDTGEDGDVPFIVMEKLPGETLADRMGAGPIETPWLLGVASNVLAALGAAHGAGLVHRDVKPANILIASDGSAKVADFGIAKSLEVASAADLTGTNQLVGTPAYVAPERLLGQPATPESDLYAVGVVLYEALAGAKPFAGPTPVAIAYAISHEDPPPLAERRPDLDSETVAAVERAMARQPQARFATAAEMAAALSQIGAPAGTPVGATDATVASSMSDPTSVLATEVGTPLVHSRVAPAGPPRADIAGSVVARARASWPTALGDRRWLVAAGLVGLFLLVTALALAGKGDQPGPTGEAKAVAGDLRDLAGELETSDGPAAAEAATQLGTLAAAVDGGGGVAEGNAFLGQLAAWKESGQLKPAAVESIRSAVLQLPGVDPNAFTPPTTAAPTTVVTEPPPPSDEDGGGGRGKGKRDRDD